MMRVVILGASGNAGTALLRELASSTSWDTGVVDSMVGVARRPCWTQPSSAGSCADATCPCRTAPHAGRPRFAWRLHVQPTEPGWVRLAEQVPMLDCTRAHEELGWWPTRDARDALREMLDGMADGAGGDSASLRRRGPLRSRVHAAGTAASA